MKKNYNFYYLLSYWRMRKILILLLIFIVYKSNVWAYQLSEAEKQSAYKIAKNIEKVVNNKTPRYKNAWYVKISKVVNNLDTNSKRYALLNEVLHQHLQMDFQKYIQKHYETYNINKSIIERYWLNLHNNARKKYNLANYSYNQKLNNTAIEWSYNNYDKQTMDHKRDTFDSWYDYNKIEKRFQDRWVHCPVKWTTTTSESIWKYGFYCTDWECSHELKQSLKEIFDIYMAEKTLSYPDNAHYKAIVSQDISKIWLGITLYKSDLPNYYEYYMATHYCTDIK